MAHRRRTRLTHKLRRRSVAARAGHGGSSSKSSKSSVSKSSSFYG